MKCLQKSPSLTYFTLISNLFSFLYILDFLIYSISFQLIIIIINPCIFHPHSHAHIYRVFGEVRSLLKYYQAVSDGEHCSKATFLRFNFLNLVVELVVVQRFVERLNIDGRTFNSRHVEQPSMS